jgi:hypothetical protein
MPMLAIVLWPSSERPLLAERAVSCAFSLAARLLELALRLAAEAPLAARFLALVPPLLRLDPDERLAPPDPFELRADERLVPLDPFEELRPRLAALLDLARCFAAGIVHLRTRPLCPSPRAGTGR